MTGSDIVSVVLSLAMIACVLVGFAENMRLKAEVKACRNASGTEFYCPCCDCWIYSSNRHIRQGALLGCLRCDTLYEIHLKEHGYVTGTSGCALPSSGTCGTSGKGGESC
jgi:hypothetical protein